MDPHHQRRAAPVPAAQPGAVTRRTQTASEAGAVGASVHSSETASSPAPAPVRQSAATAPRGCLTRPGAGAAVGQWAT
ncbi:hypothetical protein, partial [Actinomyces sp. 186855]|uniref:hypothetical protein n=1 Tax=Actinomyces sp. 186855 TaxID=2761164 RepID=UPI002017AE26